MMNMIRADLYRIFKGINIYLAIGIVILMASISVGMREVGHIGNASLDYQGDTPSLVRETTSDGLLPHTVRTEEQKKSFVTDILSSNINLYYPIIVIVFVVLMADFSNHTVKNTLSAAFSKNKYYLSKLALNLILSTALIFFNSIFLYLLNFIVNGKAYTGTVGSVFATTLKQLPMLLGVASLMTMLGFLTRKSAAFNAIVIPFQVLFQMLINALYVITKWELVGKFLYNYELQSALSQLAFSTDWAYIMTCACIGLAEIAISTAIGFQVFKKTEIK
ncbi:MAG: hypothetical protein K2N63_05390 [Lachnospiraceae bacterium]|nr:hypothetical protein [Lachnospiraceae bacterium]